MRIGVLGLSHKSAPVAVRERVAFREADLACALSSLHGTPTFKEGMILSTCNRVEIYAVLGENAVFPEAAIEFVAGFHKMDSKVLAGVMYVHQDEAAVRHAFEVAASLDSMVVGEAEILGQMKEAYRAAREANAVGPVLGPILERAFHLAKELRTTTDIGREKVSVGSAAVELASKIFEDLAGRRVLLLGTGEMASTIVRGLKKAGVTQLHVASRNTDRARAFTAEIGFGEPLDHDAGMKMLSRMDIVLASTEAVHHIVRREHILEAMARRRSQPLFLVDIAVPRNIEPEVQRMDGVFLFDIDDLQEVADSGRMKREEAAEICRDQIRRHAESLFRELSTPKAGLTSRDLVQAARVIQQEELAKTLDRLRDAPEDVRDEIRQLSERVAARLLHEPLSAIRALSRQGRGTEAADWARLLFGLQDAKGDSARLGPPPAKEGSVVPAADAKRDSCEAKEPHKPKD